MKAAMIAKGQHKTNTNQGLLTQEESQGRRLKSATGVSQRRTALN